VERGTGPGLRPEGPGRRGGLTGGVVALILHGLYVFASGDGTFTGGADPTSRMSLRQASVEVPVSFAP